MLMMMHVEWSVVQLVGSKYPLVGGLNQIVIF